jgi:hypothetical protein
VFLPFEEWAPDRAAMNTGMNRALNVLPTVEGYETAPVLEVSAYPALTETPLMIRAFRCSDSSIFTFAFCPTRIYKLTRAAWVDVSRAIGYNTASDGYWWVNQWGDTLYCGNGANLMQKFDMSGSALFADVPGSPVAKIGVIIRDFQVLFDCQETPGGDRSPYRMWWSGRLRPEEFAPSLVTQAGFRDVPDIGLLVQAVGGDYGLVNGETGMQRIDYIGPPVQFQLSRLDEDIGCLFRATMLKIAGVTYFYSQRGWRASNGGPSVAIGQGKVDAFTRSRVQRDKINLMSNFTFPDKPVFAISYVGPDSPDGWPDEVIYYNYDVKRFSEGAMRGIAFGTLSTPPIMTDDVDFGELNVDDPVFGETLLDSSDDLKFSIVAINPTDLSVLVLQQGTPDALIETRELQLIPGWRAQVTRTRLIGEGSPVYSIRAIGRDQMFNPTLFKDPYNPPETTGSVSQNRRGRYHRFDVQMSGVYKSLLGIEVDFSPAGTH